ncbi:MAG: hypothetical protein R3C25_04205 [Hyphomonadaceae bacterium]
MKSIQRFLAVAAAAGLMAAPAYAQSLNTGASGTYGQVSLRTGFEPDPYNVSVLGGGSIDLSTVSEGCIGFASQRASFTLRFTAGELPLYIGAVSDADTTIAVRAPNGEWKCDDDGAGYPNPVVSWEQPRSGRYQIWVGRYGAANEMAQTTVHISEVAPPATPQAPEGDAPDYSLDPTYGVNELASGFLPDPFTIHIQAGGELNAGVLEGCVGWVARAPDYRLNWTAGSGSLPLTFAVQSEADTTLVINDAQGNWLCNDDSEGLDPVVTVQNPPSGQYDIWVGTFAEGDLQDSVLSITELHGQ